MVVKAATSLGRNGLQDWLIQRITAIILAIYTIFLVGYMVYQPAFSYEHWQLLFSSNWMRYFTFLAILALVGHAWVGVWTITTDYLKPAMVRLLGQLVAAIALLLYLIWGIQIIWGL